MASLSNVSRKHKQALKLPLQDWIRYCRDQIEPLAQDLGATLSDTELLILESQWMRVWYENQSTGYDEAVGKAYQDGFEDGYDAGFKKGKYD